MDSEALEGMMTSLEHRGQDGAGFLIRGCIGFGHQKFCITHESLTEELPFYRAKSDIAITGDIRIDNREELLPVFGFSPYDELIPDSQLVLDAYEKWGIGMVDRLLGHYALALWDGKQQTLFLVTDHSGTRPIFFYKGKNVFIFASEIKGIHGSRRVQREIDKEHLAVHLVLPLSMHVLPEKTFFKHIRSMCAAHVLAVNRTSLKQTHYWVPDIHKRVKVKREEDWRDAFQDIFFKVMKAHLRSAFTVSALLSGGLDSSAIVAVASRILEKQGKRLTTFSSVAPEAFSGNGVDERYFIDQFKAFDNIDMHYIDDEQSGPFSHMDRWNDDTPFRMSRHFLYTAFCKAAHHTGSRVILDGVFGEHGPSFSGTGCLADALRKGKWLFVLKELFHLSHRENRRFMSLLKTHVMKPYLPANLLNWRDSSNEEPVLVPVRNEFIETWADRAFIQHLKNEMSLLFSEHINHRRNQVALYLRKRACWPRNSFAAYEMVEYNYPYADPRIIDFCLATPEHIKIRHGYKRNMIRSGMLGIMPEIIRLRTCKEPFSPDYHMRFSRQIPMVKNIFSEIQHSDPIHEIVHVAKVKKIFDEAIKNIALLTNRDKQVLKVIPMMVYLHHFLLRNIKP
ncbi:MAG: hypothetical protein KKD44_16395 [Proteobacteria bacterium]|nr:hypothetical protein [Pseudomonadota bacterium]